MKFLDNLFSAKGGAIIALILGSAVFAALIGVKIVNPQNIGWLDGGYDPTLHYLSWEYFRIAPWSFPLGLNPNFGDDIATSIVYTDTIPLLAILLKPFSNFLPKTFQYLGIWTFICYLLQGYFSWKLIGLIKKNLIIQTLGTSLFLLSPIMLLRVGEHAALASHFLIIAALYICFDKSLKDSFFRWSLLLLISLLVNIYFFAMVFILMVGSSIDLVKNKHISLAQGLIKICLILVVSGIFAYIVGYFEISTVGIRGGEYGYRQLNLFGPFDSQDWSFFIPKLPLSNPPFESFSYLGLGIILGYIALGLFCFKRVIAIYKKLGRRKYLLASIIFMLIFALSNRIAIGPHLITVPAPESLIAVASALRASGRLFWPIYYLLYLNLIFLTLKLFSLKKSIIFLLIVLAIQLIDILPDSFGRTSKLKNQNISELKINLKNQFWLEAAKKYKKIHVIPLNRSVENLPAGWHDIAIYAHQNGLKTNSVYLGRYDAQKIEKFNQKVDEMIYSGNFDADTLYIVSKELTIPILRHLKEPQKNFFYIDQHLVLAPGWGDCKSCDPIDDSMIMSVSDRDFQPNTPLMFSKNSGGVKYLVGVDDAMHSGSGWAYPEAWGVWSEGASAKLVIPIFDASIQKIILKISPFITQGKANQEIQILVNGVIAKNLKLNMPKEVDIPIDLPFAYVTTGVNGRILKDYLIIEFKIKAPKSPQELNVGDDTRKLGIGLISIQVAG